MWRVHPGLAVILILAGLSVACTQRTEVPSSVKPAKVEQIPGTNLKRVTLSPKAAERLGIRTVAVRDEQLESRKRLVGGEVVARPPATADGGKVWVRVALSQKDLSTVAVGQPASVLPLLRSADGKATGTSARAVAASANNSTLHYAIDGPNGFAPGQRVRVEVPLSGAGTRKVVPHGAVVYDAQGKTWVYASPEPHVFLRQPISIDYIEGDRAVLMDGPASGTPVVIVGAEELFGVELGGK